MPRKLGKPFELCCTEIWLWITTATIWVKNLLKMALNTI